MKNTPIVKLRLGLIALFLCIGNVTELRASTITIGGIITQSIQDGTGPSVNNPDLNNIPDGALFTVTLTFNGFINSPGTFDLTGFPVRFSVAAAGAFEDGFDLASLTVAQSGGFDQVSFFGCLTAGSGCNQGNELDLSFMVPSGQLSGQNVAAQAIPGLLPLDLLEDDGVTDIHGLITDYSFTPASAVPEPSPFVLSAFGGLLIALARVRRRSGSAQPPRDRDLL